VEEVTKPAPTEPPPPPAKPTCKLGHAIPDAIIADWNEAAAFAREHMAALSRTKVALEKAAGDRKPFMAKIHNADIAAIEGCRHTLKALVPYTVCCYCHGHQKEKCSPCKQTGWLSEHTYSSAVPAEIKAMWERKG
jgi:hypothetical protein